MSARIWELHQVLRTLLPKREAMSLLDMVYRGELNLYPDPNGGSIWLVPSRHK
jgi:hypothetical protein